MTEVEIAEHLKALNESKTARDEAPWDLDVDFRYTAEIEWFACHQIAIWYTKAGVRLATAEEQAILSAD